MPEELTEELKREIEEEKLREEHEIDKRLEGGE